VKWFASLLAFRQEYKTPKKIANDTVYKGLFLFSIGIELSIFGKFFFLLE